MGDIITFRAGELQCKARVSPSNELTLCLDDVATQSAVAQLSEAQVLECGYDALYAERGYCEEHGLSSAP